MTWLRSFLSKFAVPAKAVSKPAKARKAPSGDGSYTWADVAKHSLPDDAWMVIEGEVYDVSGFGERHPGGEVVYSYAGRDGTDAFNAFHKNSKPRAMLKAFRVGKLLDALPTQAFLLDFRAMRKQLEFEGYMDANLVFYARKVMELVLMAGFVCYMLWSGTAAQHVVIKWGCAAVLGMFFTQCGWTCHDFHHNQVFKDRRLNAVLGGLILNLGMGGSSHWWRTKHNQHHATPNRLDDNKMAVDPDIDTIPLIAWDKELLKQVEPSQRGLVRYQHVLIWPLMMIAYKNWQVQSMIHILSYPSMTFKMRVVEAAVFFVHYLWLVPSVFCNLTLLDGLAFWLFAHFMAGFMTAFVFVQSHNGMEVYGDDKDFASAQIVSTRNILPGVVMDWFCGGLNYQIEHHLFPTMPRHSFYAVRGRIQALCEKHGMEYQSVSMTESTRRVYATLEALATDAAKSHAE